MKVNEELIRSLVEKVLAETGRQKPEESKSGGCGFEKTVDPSGVLSLRVPTVRLELSTNGPFCWRGGWRSA